MSQKSKRNRRVYRKEEQLDLFAPLDLVAVAHAASDNSNCRPEMCGDRWFESGTPWLHDSADIEPPNQRTRESSWGYASLRYPGANPDEVPAMSLENP